MDIVVQVGDASHERTLHDDWTAATLEKVVGEVAGLSGGEFSDSPEESLHMPGQCVEYRTGDEAAVVTVAGELGVWDMLSGAYPRLAPLIESANFEKYRLLNDEDAREVNEAIGAVLDPIIEEIAEQGIPFPQVPIGSSLQRVPVEAGFTGEGEAERAAASLVKLMISAELVKLRRETLKPTNLGEACLDRDMDYLVALEPAFPFVFNLNEQLEAVVGTLFAFVGSGKAAASLGVASSDADAAFSAVIHEITEGHLTATSTMNRDLRLLFGLEAESPLAPGVLQPTKVGKKLMGYLLAQL